VNNHDGDQAGDNIPEIYMVFALDFHRSSPGLYHPLRIRAGASRRGQIVLGLVDLAAALARMR
jgi:hypothetical protein